MVRIVDPEPALKAEPCPVAGELRIWGDMRKDGKDELGGEFENCANRMEGINVRSKN